MDRATTSSPHDAEPAAVRFRPSKKRKTYRQRRPDARDRAGLSPAPDAEPTDDGQVDEVADAGGAAMDGDDDGSDARQPAAVRLRCDPRRGARFRGLGFAAQSRPDAGALAVGALVARAPDADDERALGGIADRFMHQTGLVADPDDRHMYAPPPLPRPPQKTRKKDNPPALISQGPIT